ncbi:hypothetical protein [Chitinimonas naiadis]
MPVNGFSVGRDLALDISTPSGPLRLSLITGFDSKPNYGDIKVKGLDGVTRHARFPDGWEGSFEVERMDSVIDNYFAQLEASYYAGINEQPCTITETITDPDGSVNQYRYKQVLLKLTDKGKWEGDKTVKQKLGFVAARREKV